MGTGTVLVTGATGHLGANLVRALLVQGRRVRVLVHRNGRALDGLDVERTPGDVRDVEALHVAMKGVEVVHHLAAVISIDGELGGLVPDVNVVGARRVAEAALAAGVRRMVHYCSIHAFSLRPPGPNSGPLDETHPRAIGPHHAAYDRSKAAGERAVREVVARGLDAVILHPTGVIGPCDYEPSRMGQVFLDLAHGRLAGLVDGGFDWVDVRDVIAGGLAAEKHGRTGESYLLSGHWSSLSALATIASEITGAPPPRFLAPMWLARAAAPFVSTFNRLTRTPPLFTSESLRALRANVEISSEKARRELGFAPRPIRESIAAVYAWFAEAGVL